MTATPTVESRTADRIRQLFDQPTVTVVDLDDGGYAECLVCEFELDDDHDYRDERFGTAPTHADVSIAPTDTVKTDAGQWDRKGTLRIGSLCAACDTDDRTHVTAAAAAKVKKHADVDTTGNTCITGAALRHNRQIDAVAARDDSLELLTESNRLEASVPPIVPASASRQGDGRRTLANLAPAVAALVEHLTDEQYSAVIVAATAAARHAALTRVKEWWNEHGTEGFKVHPLAGDLDAIASLLTLLTHDQEHEQ